MRPEICTFYLLFAGRGMQRAIAGRETSSFTPKKARRFSAAIPSRGCGFSGYRRISAAFFLQRLERIQLQNS
jgi:hypothetical protein